MSKKFFKIMISLWCVFVFLEFLVLVNFTTPGSECAKNLVAIILLTVFSPILIFALPSILSFPRWWWEWINED